MILNIAVDQKKYLKIKKLGSTGTTDWVNFFVNSNTAIQLQPQPPKIRCPRDASKSRAAVLEQSRRPTDVKLIALRVMMDDDKSNKCFFDNPFLDKCLFFLWCWSFELKLGRLFSMSLNATSTGRYHLVCCPSDLDGVVGKGYTPLRIGEAVVQFCIQVEFSPAPSWAKLGFWFTYVYLTKKCQKRLDRRPWAISPGSCFQQDREQLILERTGPNLQSAGLLCSVHSSWWRTVIFHSTQWQSIGTKDLTVELWLTNGIHQANSEMPTM